jgi:hypothetical protein
MRLQNPQQAAIPGSYRQLQDALRKYPAVGGLGKLGRTSQDTVDFSQPRIPSVFKGDPSRRKVPIGQPVQHAENRQGDEFGEL